MSTVIKTEPLTPEAFAPYGFVLMAERGDVAGRPANKNSAKRYDDLGPLVNLRPETARLNACFFRCQPFSAWPMRVVLLEKHPCSTQTFVPMNAQRYLVLVADGTEEAPDLTTLRAFVATGRQGVTYAPNVWHHPLVVLDVETDFACFVFEDTSADDCVTRHFDEATAPVVELA